MKTRQQSPVVRSDRDVESLPVWPTRRDVRVEAKGITGVQLRVSPGGRRGPTYTWAYLYRDSSGRQVRFTLGRYPTVTLAVVKRMMRGIGTDPAAAKRAAREASRLERRQRLEAARGRARTVDALCDLYLEHARQTKKTWKADEWRLDRQVRPYWGSRPVASLTRDDVRTLVRRVKGRASANRLQGLVSSLLTFAAGQDWIAEPHPARRLPLPHPEFRTRFRKGLIDEHDVEVRALSRDEIIQLWANTEAMSPAARAAVRLCLLTGRRASEVLGMRAAEITVETDPDTGTARRWWTLPAVRAKNGTTHRLPLLPMALAEIGALTADEQGRLFHGQIRKQTRKATDDQAFAGLAHRGKPRHSLRATLASELSAAGVPLEVVAAVLNHSRGAASGLRVTAGYVQREYDADKVAALAKWEQRLRSMLTAAQAADAS
jgi:integrase